MKFDSDQLRVTTSPDGFYPRFLRWQGRQVRVLCVEEMYTRGRERRYRLRTPEGMYEVGFVSDTREWQMRRAPSLLRRWWARIQAMPRFPAPATRRRRARQLVPQPGAAGQHRPQTIVAMGVLSTIRGDGGRRPPVSLLKEGL